ncbi:MAG TPA: STAS domain-containing protein [Acidimicrobiales bacterium]|nr:STAS domain-containing protein [Acidimicrobiales bacterium]
MALLSLAGCRFDFAIATRQWCGWTIVEVDGELDVYTASLLHARLGALAVRHPGVVIDLSGVPFLDASGLGVLVEGLSRARAGGGTLRLAGPSRLARLLEIAGLEAVLPMYPSAEAAVADGDGGDQTANGTHGGGPHRSPGEDQR